MSKIKRKSRLPAVKNVKGFTLIEVMIVVVIVAILAAVAVPSYQNSIQKTKRADAKESLTRAAAAQERHFFTNNAYTADLAKLGFAKDGDKFYSGDGYYEITMGTEVTCGTGSNPKYPCYTMTATAAADRAQSKDTLCKTFVIEHTGKTTSESAEKNDSTKDCW